MKTYIIRKRVNEPTFFERNNDGWVKHTIYLLQDEFGNEYPIETGWDKSLDEIYYSITLSNWSYTGTSLKDLFERLNLNGIKIANPFKVL